MRFLLFLVLLFSWNAFASTAGFLARIESHYIEENSKKDVKVEGTGFTVFAPSSQSVTTDSNLLSVYVVTAAHVSQGANTKVFLGDQELRIVNRLADNFNDIEVLQVNGSGVSILGVLGQDVKHLSPNDLYFESKDVIPVMSWVYRDLYGELSGGAWLRSVLNFFSYRYPFDYIEGEGVGEAFRERILIPYPGWASYRPGDASDKTVKSAMGGFTSRHLIYGSEMQSAIEISPGMSGAPVIREVDWIGQNQLSIVGMVSRKLRFFGSSFFVEAPKILELIDLYVSGKRGRVDATQWKYSYGITHRDFGGGTSEVNFVSLPMGNGIGSDGGNGISSDGARAGRQAEFFLNMPGGMIWKGQPILGFKINFVQDVDSLPLYLYGDVAALDFLRKNADSVRFQPIASETSLLEVAFERFSKPLLSSDGQSQVQFDRDKIHFDLKVSGGERLKFDLDSRGGLPGQAGYYVPLIQVKDSETYLVDTHDFFFTDLSTMLIGNIGEAKRALEHHSKALRLRVRGIDSKSENIFEFSL